MHCLEDVREQLKVCVWGGGEGGGVKGGQGCTALHCLEDVMEQLKDKRLLRSPPPSPPQGLRVEAVAQGGKSDGDKRLQSEITGLKIQLDTLAYQADMAEEDGAAVVV